VLTTSKLAGLMAAAGLLLVHAQQPSVDPDAGSPAGTIYELPLDSARQDAAPKHPPRTRTKHDAGHGGAAGGSGTNGGSGTHPGAATTTSSAIRSENGFGSSDSVPGARATDRVRGEPAVTAHQPAGRRGRALGSANVRDASAGNPSSTAVYILLGLVVLVAATLGLAARARRRDLGDGGGG
jgi:hypothetical protein